VSTVLFHQQTEEEFFQAITSINTDNRKATAEDKLTTCTTKYLIMAK